MEQGKFGLVLKNVVGGGIHRSLFDKIISLPNLFAAWREFLVGKKKKTDALTFAADAEERIFDLHEDLVTGVYIHGGYEPFFVTDPKRRHIHKASVRDRLLHHAVHRILYPYFDRRFIFDSYSSRRAKGTHAGVKRFRDFAWRVSQNGTRPVFALKADIRNFFDSIDHGVLLAFLSRALPQDDRLFRLLAKIIGSFHKEKGKGIPLGNLTSQLFANVYLNPFDQYVKRRLCIKYYIRYADDIVIISSDRNTLIGTMSTLKIFLENILLLSFHSGKISVREWRKGIDVLGFVSSFRKTILRPKTLTRMFNKLSYAETPDDFAIAENALYSRMKFER